MFLFYLCDIIYTCQGFLRNQIKLHFNLRELRKGIVCSTELKKNYVFTLTFAIRRQKNDKGKSIFARIIFAWKQLLLK